MVGLYIEEISGKYQCHFISRHATIDRMFVTKLVTEKTFEFSIHFNLFTDFKQADTLARKCQYEILREFRILKKLVNLVRMALKDSN